MVIIIESLRLIYEVPVYLGVAAGENMRVVEAEYW